MKRQSFESGEEVAIFIEDNSVFSLVTFNEIKSSLQENLYYFYGSANSKLYELELTIRKEKWVLKKKEFNSKNDYEEYKTTAVIS